MPAVNAAITNTADPDEIIDYSTRVGGAGLIDPDEVVTTDVVALGNEGSGTLTFGYREASQSFVITRSATLRNYGDSAAVYTTSVEWSEDAGGAASISFAPGGQVTVPAKGERRVQVLLHVDSPQVPAEFVTASGNIVFEPVGGAEDASNLRMPFMAVPNATSALRTNPPRVTLDAAQDTVQFTTVNPSPVSGTADVYAWGLSDSRDRASVDTDVRAVGVQSFPEDGVGVFAINTFTQVSSPSVNEWDVLLDVDEDREFDYAVIGLDIGLVFGGALNGQLGSFTVDLETGAILGAFFAGGGLNTSHVLLPFPLDAVGLSEDGNPDFAYVSAVFSLFGFPEDVVSGTASFNMYDQPVETGAFFEVEGNGQTGWTAALDPAGLAEYQVKGFMAVYANNHTGRRQAQTIPVTARP